MGKKGKEHSKLPGISSFLRKVEVDWGGGGRSGGWISRVLKEQIGICSLKRGEPVSWGGGL